MYMYLTSSNKLYTAQRRLLLSVGCCCMFLDFTSDMMLFTVVFASINYTSVSVYDTFVVAI